ncbi:MAG: rRNA maturation RNase YbeY [Muribaculaceae bacterium]|nr:rRNA maturation RNase YbeY [Muribaculaceae bacterium]
MISFNSDNIEKPPLDYPKIVNWLNLVASSFDKKIGNLNYIFCNDEEILRINRKFLNHDYYTDIITFDYSHKNRIGGDLFISLDTVKSNAHNLSIDFEDELLRVIVHGVLHLCGIDDKGPGEREIMEECENNALSLYIREA